MPMHMTDPATGITVLIDPAPDLNEAALVEDDEGEDLFEVGNEDVYGRMEAVSLDDAVMAGHFPGEFDHTYTEDPDLS